MPSGPASNERVTVGGHANRVEPFDLDDLVVQLHAAEAREHHVHLFRVVVAVSEGLPLAGLDPVVAQPVRSASRSAVAKRACLNLTETELRRGAVDVGQLLVRERAGHLASPSLTTASLTGWP